MNIFYRFGEWVSDGIRRVVGLQSGSPNAYSEPSATPVTFDTAMQLSAVWSCVKLLSETISSLPLNIYKKGENGRVLAETHPLQLLFAGKVNQYQTKIEFFETVLLNLVVNGNAYCVIQRLGDRIVGLLPLMSAQMQVTLLENGSVVYEYQDGKDLQIYASSSIWHLKLMGNGVIGMSPLDYQRNTLGIAQAAERQVSKIYANGGKPSGVVTVDKFLNDEQRKMIKEKYGTMFSGTENRLMVLEGGMKFDAISLSPQDIELLESRKFQIAEICRWYGVPSVMVNDTSSSTVWGSGIEQIVQGFYKITLRPMIEKIEASIICNLMKPAEWSRYEVEFDFNALTRSTPKDRYETYRIGIYGGFITPNEARRYEGMPDKEGGDELFMQGANMSVTDILKEGGQDGITDQANSGQ